MKLCMQNIRAGTTSKLTAAGTSTHLTTRWRCC